MAKRAFEDLYGEDELFQVFAQKQTRREGFERWQRALEDPDTFSGPLGPFLKRPTKFHITNRNGEKELGDWVESLGLTIERNNRKLIRPYELDVYVPELQLAIEFNGSYWHSSKHLLARRGVTAEQFHAFKTREAASAGVILALVWDDDWFVRGSTVKKALKDLFSTGVMDPLLQKLVGPLG